MEKIELSVTRDMGQTIGDPFLFARQNFKLLAKGFLYFLLPLLLIALVLTGIGYSNIFSGFGKRYSAYGSPSFASSLTYFVPAYILYFIVSLLQQAYVYEYMILYERGTEVALSDVWNQIKKDWAFILITYLATIPLLLGFVLAAFLVIWASPVLGSSFAGFLAFLLYLFLMYAAIPYSNFPMVRLRERLGIIPSLVKCFRITAGKWWRTFFSMIIMVMIFYSVLLVFVLPVYFVVLLSVLHQAGSLSSLAGNGTVLGIYMSVVLFAMILMFTLFYVFIGVNYYSLSEKHDSYGLINKIHLIGEHKEVNIRKQEGEY